MNHQNLTDQIVEAEERLRQAMLQSDVATLDNLISPELLFTSHVGQLVTKQQDLDAHASGRIKIREITVTDRQILPVQGVVVVSTQVAIAGVFMGEEASGNFRFTRVWAPSRAGLWQIVAGHSCLVSE